MWTKSAEERLEELGFTEKQIEQLSEKTMVGVGIITSECWKYALLLVILY